LFDQRILKNKNEISADLTPMPTSQIPDNTVIELAALENSKVRRNPTQALSSKGTPPARGPGRHGVRRRAVGPDGAKLPLPLQDASEGGATYAPAPCGCPSPDLRAPAWLSPLPPSLPPSRGASENLPVEYIFFWLGGFPNIHRIHHIPFHIRSLAPGPQFLPPSSACGHPWKWPK